MYMYIHTKHSFFSIYRWRYDFIQRLGPMSEVSLMALLSKPGPPSFMIHVHTIIIQCPYYFRNKIIISSLTFKQITLLSFVFLKIFITHQHKFNWAKSTHSHQLIFASAIDVLLILDTITCAFVIDSGKISEKQKYTLKNTFSNMVTWTHLPTMFVIWWVVPTNSYNLGLPTLTSPVSWCLSDHRHFDHPSKKTK